MAMEHELTNRGRGQPRKADRDKFRHVSVTMPPAMADLLADEAKRSGRKLSRIVVERLTWAGKIITPNDELRNLRLTTRRQDG